MPVTVHVWKDQTMVDLVTPFSIVLPVTAGWSADQVAGAINAQSGSTGVSASATTTATMGALSATATTSFNLGSAKTSLTSISVAALDKDDLTALVAAINEKSGQTGISAQINAADKTEFTLTQTDGKDIFISAFTNGVATMEVTGSADVAAITLTGGGNNATTVSGEVTLTSTDSFSATSSVTAAGGSVFNVGIGVEGAHSTSAVSSIDISSVTGANSAIGIVDAALSKISGIRGDLGSIQNRLESTIANLQSVSENVASARARILDADFAAETAEMTKAQVMQQAGVAMLAQANMLPQTVLSLLQ